MRARTLHLLLFIGCIGLGIVIDRQVLRLRGTPSGVSRAAASSTPRGGTNAVARPASMVAGGGGSHHVVLATLAEMSAALDAALTNRFFRQRADALDEMLSAIDPGSLPEAVSLVPNVPEGPLRAQFIQSLVSLWAEHDPKAALAYAGTLPTAAKSEARSAVLNTWARQDPDELLAWAEQWPPGAVRDEAWEHAIIALADDDPTRAFEMMKKLPAGSAARFNSLLPLFSAWAQRDPATAAAKAMELRADSNREVVLGQVMSEWGARDPNAALTWAGRLMGAQRGIMEQTILSAYARQDPAAAAELIRALPPGGTREHALVIAAGELAKTDPTAAVELANSISQRQGQYAALKSIAHALLNSEPERAAELVLEFPSHARNSIVDDVASQWASLDLDAALTWARGLSDETLKQSALKGLIAPWTDSNPRAAAEYALSFPAGDQRNSLLLSVGEQWALTDPRAAMDWAGQLPPGRAQTDLVPRIASSWADTEPEAAAHFVESLPAGEMRNSASTSLATEWALHDTPAAAQWVLTLPEGESRDETLDMVVREWADNDPNAAAAWLEQLPQGAAREAALSAFIGKVSEHEPEVALKWANTIQTEEARLAQYEIVAENWMNLNAMAARDWISSSPLPKEVKARLLRPEDDTAPIITPMPLR